MYESIETDAYIYSNKTFRSKQGPKKPENKYKVLHSVTNPSGRKLEELLREVCYDLGLKSKDYAASSMTHKEQMKVIQNNEEMITHLEHCKRLQVENLAIMEGSRLK